MRVRRHAVLGVAMTCLAHPSVQAATAGAPPAEGISVEARAVIERPADGLRLVVVVAAEGATAALARARLDDDSAALRAALPEEALAPAAAPSLQPSPQDAPVVADGPLVPAADGRAWRASREFRFRVERRQADAALGSLATLRGVSVLSATSTLSTLPDARRLAVEQATDEAGRKAAAAANRLGFTLGTVQEVKVADEERRSEGIVEAVATVTVRFSLLPATSRSEVLAIAAASSVGAESPRVVDPQADASPAAPAALAVEIVEATYDTSGRGRFTTATGTVWREVVPAPADQRLKPGRRYRGTVTLGAISGYRMALEGVPRILKVQPAGDVRR